MAQPPSLPVENAQPIAPKPAADLREAGSFFSWGEIQLTLIIFIFGLIALGVFAWLVRTGRASPLVMRLYVIIILVFGTLLVVSSAYSTEQIAPIVGFFGTIAGYLMGKSERSNEDPS